MSRKLDDRSYLFLLKHKNEKFAVGFILGDFGTLLHKIFSQKVVIRQISRYCNRYNISILAKGQDILDLSENKEIYPHFKSIYFLNDLPLPNRSSI